MQVKDSLKVLMGVTHGNVTAACQEYFSRYRRHVYVTPKSYLSFLEVYQSVYTKKLTETRAMAAAVNSGLAEDERRQTGCQQDESEPSNIVALFLTLYWSQHLRKVTLVICDSMARKEFLTQASLIPLYAELKHSLFQLVLSDIVR